LPDPVQLVDDLLLTEDVPGPGCVGSFSADAGGR